MSVKGLSKTVIAAIIVVVLLISAVAVYFAFSGGDQTADTTDNTELDTTDNTSTEPEEETPETETEPEEEEPETSPDVSTATSIRYTVSIQPAGQAGMEYEYIVKDAGTDNMKMRISVETEYEVATYIINGEDQTAWVYTGEEWLELSDAFSTYWDMHKDSWEGYQANLQDWTGVGEYRYDLPTGDSIIIHDIEINPTLDDSLFQVAQS